MAFSDIDGAVEVNGRFLFQEWKEHTKVPAGQRIMFQRLTTNGRVAVFLITGDAETMEVREFATFWRGKFSGWAASSLEEVKDRIRSWAQWAQTGAS